MTAKPDPEITNTAYLHAQIADLDYEGQHDVRLFLLGALAVSTPPDEWRRQLALALELHRQERTRHAARALSTD